MKMKAVIQRGYGGPEVLQVEEVDAPQLSNPNDVLVRKASPFIPLLGAS